MNLIFVKFRESGKKYTFLSNLELHTGDIIKDRRYSTPYTVTLVHPNYGGGTKYRGLWLLWITMDDIQSIKSDRTRITEDNMENRRNISITLEQAREWYSNGNRALREIALQAFTKDEIEEPQTYEELKRRLHIEKLEIEAVTSEPLESELPLKKAMLNLRLHMVASYFNRFKVLGMRDRKFFIGRTCASLIDTIRAKHLFGDFCILEHYNSKYPGVVYFASAEDAEKAFNMLKEYFLDLD